MNPLNALKEYQKDLAQAIRLTNSYHRDKKFEIERQPYNDFCQKYELPFITGGMSWNFRHHHIAYCELRGRTREQIELPADDNKPDNKWIDQIKTEWLEKIDETLRSNA